jgi:hypothetical protein
MQVPLAYFRREVLTPCSSLQVYGLQIWKEERTCNSLKSIRHWRIWRVEAWLKLWRLLRYDNRFASVALGTWDTNTGHGVIKSNLVFFFFFFVFCKIIIARCICFLSWLRLGRSLVWWRLVHRARLWCRICRRS